MWNWKLDILILNLQKDLRFWWERFFCARHKKNKKILKYMHFSYVHEFDLQSLKKLLTCNIKSIGKFIYIYIWLVSWFQQYHHHIVIYGVTQCMWKKEAITLQFRKCSKKNQTHIFFSLLQVKKSTQT
jgi:hypothetical protein